MTNSIQARLRWLLAPAVDVVPRSHARAAAALRVLLGLMWLDNVSWKRPPDFGQDSGSGLFKFTSYAVSDPVFAPYSWVVEHLVLPNFVAFGWAVLFVETALAVLLLTGAYVRAAAVIGLAQSVAIGLSVAFAPDEWPWSYWLMIGAHALVLVSSAGRVLAVDALRARLDTGKLLGFVWGTLSVVIGLVAVTLSLGDPLAAQGVGVKSTGLSLSLGEYNLLGGLLLVAAGVLILLVGRGGPRRFAMGAAALAVLAGFSLHAQLGFSDPLLGGSATSAAYFLSLAVVAAFLGRHSSPAATPKAA